MFLDVPWEQESWVQREKGGTKGVIIATPLAPWGLSSFLPAGRLMLSHLQVPGLTPLRGVDFMSFLLKV